MSRSPVLFLTVAGVGAFLVLATSVSTPGESAAEFEKRITISQEEVDAPPDPELTEAQTALQAELQEIGEGFAGVVGIAITEADSLATMSYNGTAPMPQQSVSKLWVTMTALDRVDEGALDLSERVTIGREDLTVFYQPIRNIVKARGSFTTDYGDLIDRAITQSDNTANDRLLRHVGGVQAVEGFLRRNAIEGVQFGTDERTKQSRIAGLEWRQSYSQGNTFYDARDEVPEADRRAAFEDYLDNPMDGATAEGLARALARLARGDLLSEESTQLLLETMSRTKSGPRRLKGGVPAGWEFGHKTGTGQFFDGVQSGYNDVGILTAPDGTRYALVVLIGQTRASYAARMEMMQDVTRRVVRYHEARESNVEA
ncbi:serine hydrolase [Qipengyuania aurantiaca]|uniref:beta-lactamase n=1 Tax=Qipengyuania aurantiaca TaxID=2867233 RepID=A0ABX8ZL95_9SPHN|nr:serine hydrolase [Qipengyuania aurantiaca]QZD89736.1 serine hydrolase [Qipengyuania aurantiaca]